jgi:hypothetical protein
MSGTCLGGNVKKVGIIVFIRNEYSQISLAVKVQIVKVTGTDGPVFYLTP